MHQEVARINGNNTNKTNNKKIISSKSLPEEPSTAKSCEEEGNQPVVEDLERTMQSLAMTNGRMMVMGHGQPIDCPPRPIERQFDQQEGILPSSSSSSTSSSSNSSIEAGLNGIGCAGREQQTTPKRSKAKKCLHLNLMSISNVNGNAPFPSPAASERLNGGILSPWNQPQFQPRRIHRPSRIFPVHILPNLYLGNDETAKNWETLEKCGIRYIVNVTSDLPNYFEHKGAEMGDGDRIVYMRIPVDDNCSHNLAQFFPQAISFIEKARNERAAVLVHCWAGISRSVTVCLAYLMYSLRCPLEEAFDRLLKQNGTIAPNFHFMEALTHWEQELFASSFSSSAMGIHLPSTPPKLHHHLPANSKSPGAIPLSPRSPSAFNQISLEAQAAAVP